MQEVFKIPLEIIAVYQLGYRSHDSIYMAFLRNLKGTALLNLRRGEEPMGLLYTMIAMASIFIYICVTIRFYTLKKKKSVLVYLNV